MTFAIETQEQKEWCWAAVAATVGQYFFPQSPVRQCQIASEVVPGVNGTCCDSTHVSQCDQPAALESALNALTNIVQQKLNKTSSDAALSFSEVQSRIDSGLPVCVHISWEDGNGHFVMISGYAISSTSGNWVDVSDPALGTSFTPYDEFTNSYLGIGRWDASYLVGPA